MDKSEYRLKLIRDRITESLEPIKLTITDESHLHEGHEGAKESGGGHFHVVITSDSFADKTQIERHRLIYMSLGDAMGTEIHALSIEAKTQSEIQQEELAKEQIEKENNSPELED